MLTQQFNIMMIVLESVPIAEKDVLYYRYVFNQTATVLRVNKIIKKLQKPPLFA